MTTSLTLQALLKSAIAKAHLGAGGGAHLAGLTPQAQAFYVAAAAHRQAPGQGRGAGAKTLLVVVPTDSDAEQMSSDVRFFLAALEGLSEAAVQEAVLPFPSHEVDPYRGLSPHMSVLSARTKALHAAATGKARVVVASATALLPRLSAPSRLLAASLSLKAGEEIDPHRLAERLVEAGFNREDPVDEHGEFCVRGGVLDVYPMGSGRPLRLDFVGDTLESIREYDPSTQRSTGEVPQALVLPLREVFSSRMRDAGVGARGTEGSDDGGPARASAARTGAPFGAYNPPSPRVSSTFATENTRTSPAVNEGRSAEDDSLWAWHGEDDWDEDDGGAGADLDPFVGTEAGTGIEAATGIRPVLFEDGADLSSTLLDYVQQPLIYVCEPEDVRARAEKSLEQLSASHQAMAIRGQSLPVPQKVFTPLDDITALFELGTTLEELEILAGDQQTADGGQQTAVHSQQGAFPTQPTPEFRGRIGDWAAEIRAAREKGETVLFVAATPGRAERTVEVLRDYELLAVPVFVDPRQRDNIPARGEMVHGASLLVATGDLTKGFVLPAAALRIYAETDVFEEERRPSERRRAATKTFLSDFRDLKVGDHVVHVDHGIGVFVGLKQIAVDPYGGATQEFLELRYAGEDKLFVPVERLDLLQKYTGAGRPALDRLGGTTWERAKTRVKKAMRDMAEELLKLYAARKALGGHAFSPDTHWQEEFEAAFEYELTPDQQAAIGEIKADMESPTPMDRLLCGDVGYGKTEVAMRAAFKAVMDGKQVAFLAPTTVLAFQHLKTLHDRFAGFPVSIDMVSRFRSRQEIKETLQDLADGKLDIIVGTHRLLSQDVKFKELGLLVVDEEQRFGVAHKERIKQMRRKVDVLTMTATPIPRTLNMSLVGIRDMSVIETPPKDRLAIQTNVVRFDQELIGRVVRNELARGGQVYFVHNRVESIYSIGQLLGRLVPEASVVVAHGQMGEDALERAMVDFVGKKHDVLLATTIVENGLDIPNVNTIVINRADRYGLSQLYQLRGRVGRCDRPAYAYLLVPPGNTLSPIARKRLAAIREFSDLGSGFRVAALDLEIRGAGNLLGGEQSGHIEAIGFEMYLKLLEQTVRELKGEEVEDETRATVNLGIDLRIDEEYVPEQNQRLALYRRVAGARTDEELEAIVSEIEDRYGPMPPEVLNLVDYGRIRILADKLGLEKIDRQASVVVLTFKPNGSAPSPERVIRLVQERPELSLAPPSGLKLDLSWRAKLAAAAGPRPVAGKARPGSVGFAEAGGLKAAGSPRLGNRGLKPGARGGARSWWTARATEEEVKPGFRKEAMLRPEKEDPRAAGGVLDRVSALLRELAAER